MKPKIVEVITKILEALNNNVSLEELNHSLMKSKEYDEQTLGIAFSLIYDKILLKKKKTSKQPKHKGSIRVLSEQEREILGIENYNYLLHLMNLGLIESDNLELLLEQINFYPENKLTRKEINWIILISLIDLDSEIPFGSRLHLYSSDSVN
ncbi:MAG: DUF494 family protein [Melioribacteraceae bacterium]|jgi:uncharacterized protein Smg (DUF494 family)|nr:DUF494 family protein [Melioribacteraceae bacterium]